MLSPIANDGLHVNPVRLFRVNVQPRCKDKRVGMPTRTLEFLSHMLGTGLGPRNEPCLQWGHTTRTAEMD